MCRRLRFSSSRLRYPPTGTKAHNQAIPDRSGSNFETDAPIDNNGKGERFSPTDLMATSLGTCMITVMGIKARTLGFDLTGIRADVLKIMKSDPRRVGGIELTFHIPEILKLVVSRF